MLQRVIKDQLYQGSVTLFWKTKSMPGSLLRFPLDKQHPIPRRTCRLLFRLS